MNNIFLRKNKTCLNCQKIVEQRFCTYCGQENLEKHLPFYFLFIHFIEDFTHYDGQFWKTIKYLLFNPGKLTLDYLSGKRKRYVDPIKLYIFISFAAFLVPSFIPDQYEKQENLNTSERITFIGAHNLKEYEKLEKNKPAFFAILKPIAKKIFDLKNKNFTQKDINDKFEESANNLLPKALFFYLPILTLFLWIMHNKKKWWYFDHGIFTLHYTSNLLLLFLFNNIFEFLSYYILSFTFSDLISSFIYIIIVIYSSVYFFIAHHRVYERSKLTSFIKTITFFAINLLGIFIFLIVLMYVSFILIH